MQTPSGKKEKHVVRSGIDQPEVEQKYKSRDKSGATLQDFPTIGKI